MWIQPTALFLHLLPRHKSVTMVVCLTFTLRIFLCIILQRNPATSKTAEMLLIITQQANQTKPNREQFLFRHYACLSQKSQHVSSGSLKVNVRNRVLCTRVKSLRHVEGKEKALFFSPLQGKFCKMQFLFVKMREKSVTHHQPRSTLLSYECKEKISY